MRWDGRADRSGKKRRPISQLSGHERGAFTGAVNSHVGHFLLADRGTLFLNEIGDMPNDVPMFEKSGASIAMGSASSEVQAPATYVTSRNEKEGFAKSHRGVRIERAFRESVKAFGRSAGRSEENSNRVSLEE